MKKMIFLIWLSILCPRIFTQGNWEQILPYGPTTNQIVSLSFSDEQTGWAVGEYGTILKTTNGGMDWRIIEIPWLHFLLDVFFPTKQVGYAVGQEGQIIKTTDGGETWQRQVVAYSNNLHRVRFRDENEGWIVGEKGLLLHTTDGGIAWQQQTSHTREDLNGITFIEHTGMCVVGNGGTILLSEDEGQSWQPVTFEPRPVWGENPAINLKDVFFLDATFGWIAGTVFRAESIEYPLGIILDTVSGGKTWQDQPHYFDGLLKIFSGLQQIYFSDIQHGLCLVDKAWNYWISGNIPYYSESTGRYWVSGLEEIEGSSLEKSSVTGRLAFLSDNRVINTGYRGEFRFSDDKGKTWYFPDSSRRKFIGLSMCQRGYLFTIKRYADGPLISKDYGKTWQALIPRFFDKNGNSVNSITDNSIVVNDDYLTSIQYDSLSQKRIIYVSTDCGETFNQKYEVEASIPYVQIIAPDTLIKYSLKNNQTADGNASKLEFSYSFDGGKTVASNTFPGLWNNLTFPIYDSYIYDCCFLNGHTGFIVGTDGNILKTTNTGRSWRNIQSSGNETLWDITFIDANTGFIAGNFGRILKTTDGGETWRRTNSGTQENIFTVAFRNRNEGWAGTVSGLRYTEDGGETWKSVPMRYQHGHINEILFDSKGNGYASNTIKFGESSSKSLNELQPYNYTYLLYLKNPGKNVAATPTGEIPVKSLILQPNYPNPFNSATHIRFFLPENELVSLKIYNIQGQLVRTLVDEIREPGEHSVVWDGTSNAGEPVASGMFFMRLTGNGEFRVQKLLVLN